MWQKLWRTAVALIIRKIRLEWWFTSVTNIGNFDKHTCIIQSFCDFSCYRTHNLNYRSSATRYSNPQRGYQPTIISVRDKLKMKRLLILCRLLLHKIDTHRRKFPNVASREKSAMLSPRSDLSVIVNPSALMDCYLSWEIISEWWELLSNFTAMRQNSEKAVRNKHCIRNYW